MIFRNLLVFFLILILFLSSANPLLSNAEDTKKKVLLVYDRRSFFGFSGDIVTSYRELFGHFNVDVLEEIEEDYKKGQADDFDFIFVIGIEGDFFNSILLEDLKKTKKTVCWIGRGIEKLLEKNKRVSFTYDGESGELVKVFYRKKSFDIGLIDNFTIIDNISSNSKVYSWLSDGKNMYPYIIRENNYWYVSRAISYSVLFYIFADVLYDLFNEYSKIDKSRVFIRIEDVHPFRDTEKLRAIAEYLNSKKVPFMIAMIPAYKSQNSSYITPLSEKPEFIKTIKYMQKLGGSIILHGYAHQAFGGELTGEGFEFWDGINDKPLSLDIENWIYKRIGLGIQECVKNGIYPLAFEAPHYAVSQRGYKVLKKYFSTYCGHIQTSDQGFATTSYPYILYDTELFHKFIPENLGYVDPNNPLTINDIKNNFEKVSIVRGFTAGVFFHPYLDIKYLKEIVEMLKSENIEFYDLKKEDNWVKWNNINIMSKNGEICVDYSENSKDDSIKKGFAKGIKILIIFVLFVNAIFFYILIKSKKKANKDLLGD
ncbi:Uncharacterized protein YdaL [Caminicella sporogenes DSM 14501]|uniref:Uncharacterized protein YdaL n=1 Tax=Caminicella sporogenes DSM 14501 TaxID=1121266 RepID=A0A1M6Q9K3_9FIRM|nr:polysaccharide deacetylase family protein [Caminicella sporogenes]SHK16777.1 Uncharacterized protein YdaL [Caminicella sporogenes DSM 14501]